MNPWPVEAEVEEVHLPRPGHADLVGRAKFGHRDVRNVLERASARETAARVAAGARRQGLPARARRQRPQPRDPDRLGARRPERETSRRRTSPASTTPRFAASTPRRSAAMVGRDRPPAQGEREPRRHLRGARLRPRARASARTSPGRSGSTAGSRRRVASIQSVKGVAIGEAWDVAGAPGLGGPRRDLPLATSAASTARPTTPAASRAG